MAIDTYATLQTAMSNWTDRSDKSDRFPECIALFEAKVNRRLRLRPQQTTATITMSSGSGTLPTDYLHWKRVTWQGTPKRGLDYVEPDFLSRQNAAQSSGNPINFTIEGSTIKVAPLSDTSLEILYDQKVPALSASATTNWLLTAHPDGYLFGSLTMLATITEDMDALAMFDGLTQGILGELWGLEFATRGAMAQRVLGPTP